MGTRVSGVFEQLLIIACESAHGSYAAQSGAKYSRSKDDRVVLLRDMLPLFFCYVLVDLLAISSNDCLVPPQSIVSVGTLTVLFCFCRSIFWPTLVLKFDCG